MAEKHIVVQGGTCQCKFSVEPKTDVLKVNTQSMHYANDKEGKEKLIATDKDIGQTLDKNTFGKCKMQPNGSGDFLPCQAVITQWSDFYDKVTLSNQGKILLEDSKATCPIGGPDCITIKNHGQTGEGSQQQAKESDTVAQNQANPVFADFNDNQTQAKAEEKPQGPEEKREIVKVVPEDIDGKVIPKGEKYHYGKVVNVVVHTTGMVGELVHVELWEDDAIGAGHSDENRYNKVMEQFAFVGEKGVAEVRFVIQNAYRSIAVTHNAKEGKTHEYYFMVYAPQVINTSGNINIYAPEYVEEKKRVIEEKLKGIEPKPVQEPKQKIKAEAPKIVVPAKVATPKPAPKPAAPAAPAAVVPKKITYIYFTDDKGNKITNSDYGNTIRATIGSTGLVGHTVKLRVYDKEWLGDPHLLTKDPIVKTITSNLCYVEIPLTEAMKKLGGNMWYDDVYVDIEIVETKAHIKSQSITVDTNRFSFDLPDNETKSKLGERDSKKETSECFCKQKENQFYWSNQLTCDQRKKVLQVCSELWGESKKKEKASELMSIFHLETGSKDTFKPYADNGKGYSGLIQFSDASAEKLGTTRAKLKAMTFIEQMDYVKKYLQKNKDKFATLTDFYLQVLKPNAVGQGGNPDYVLFDESVTVPDGDGSTTSQVQRMKNITQEPWVTKYGYASNPPFMLQDGENTKRKKWVYTRQRFEQRYGFMNGKTTVKEVTEVVKKQHYDLGKPNVFFGKCEKIKEEKKEVKDRAQWMPFALNEVGQKAISGKKDNNPRITEYFTASTNGNGLDEGTNWCGAFVSWCFSQANYTPPALSCRAAMWQFWKQDKPIYGSAAVIDWDSNQSVKPNGKDGAVGGSGHITFVVGISPDGNHYYCVGGNQGGVKGARTVKISKYSKNDIDWFVIPPNYIPTNEEYTLKVMNSEADVDTAKTTRT